MHPCIANEDFIILNFYMCAVCYPKNPTNESNISGTRVLVFPGGPVPFNKFVRTYCEKAKPLMQGLMEHANMVSPLIFHPWLLVMYLSL